MAAARNSLKELQIRILIAKQKSRLSVEMQLYLHTIKEKLKAASVFDAIELPTIKSIGKSIAETNKENDKASPFLFFYALF
ncbi:hypothetical protein F7Q91_03535 [Vibrio chagasii]|uniref:Uncharacterized protein n=1 Tax=Vibrio chagasii TaxID=170679 RepID=A0A7V7NX21_9VIBR|nr:hypothetical protein [Vibrio chagasii]KAB0482495.1 hypothetical protein F7Q91_03535 [Vibrio chagasii]